MSANLSELHFKNFTCLESERLILRKLTLNDIDDIFSFTSLPETSKILSWYPHANRKVTLKFVQGVIEKYENNVASQWAIELKSIKKVIGIAGFIQLLPEHARAEIAYVLSPLYQNKGYMTETLKMVISYGFTSMKLNRIEAKCEIDNHSSERVMQKIGMHLEGTFTHYLKRKGLFRDYKFYVIINRLS
jgi:[ribosomal protein S5]-alanine N-acetyltransferase